MLEPLWKRIAGFHVEDAGTLGAVWLAQDDVTSVIYVYDAAVFAREVPAVISEGIAARGRYYPLAWRKEDKAMADMFLDAGINVLYDPSPDDPGTAAILSRQIWQGLRSKKFFVDKRVTNWRDENKRYFLDDQR